VRNSLKAWDSSLCSEWQIGLPICQVYDYQVFFVILRTKSEGSHF
jgi:hypothetical protein